MIPPQPANNGGCTCLSQTQSHSRNHFFPRPSLIAVWEFGSINSCKAQIINSSPHMRMRHCKASTGMIRDDLIIRHYIMMQVSLSLVGCAAHPCVNTSGCKRGQSIGKTHQSLVVSYNSRPVRPSLLLSLSRRAELERILQQMNSSSRSRKLGCLDEKCMIASFYDSNG